MKIWQAGVSAVLVVALAASIPGLYNYTEAGARSSRPDEPSTKTPVDRLNLTTVEDLSHPAPPDSSQLPSTSFQLEELTGVARRDAQRILRIDITEAPKEQLTSITGIGSSTAETIVEYRNANEINSLSDLENIPGIGPATAEKIGREILINGNMPGS